MTILCDLIDCIYNSDGIICTKDPCLISNGMCEWVYQKKYDYSINPYYDQKIREVNNE